MQLSPTPRHDPRTASHAPGTTLLVLALHDPTPPPPVTDDSPCVGESCRPRAPVADSMPRVTTPAIEDGLAYRRRTALALASAQRDLHRYTLEAMDVALSGAPVGGHSACGRRIAFLAKRVKILAILLDRADGATWRDIAAQWGLTAPAAQEVFEPMERAWADGNLAPWAPHVEGGVMATGVMPVHVAEPDADGLRAYYWAHAVSPGGGPSGN